MSNMQDKTISSYAIKVSVVTIILNVVLSAFKLVAGILGHSSAMISDAAHSLSDVFSTFVVIAGIKMAARESDANHQYGHERFESVATILLSLFLFAVGLGIGYSGLQKIFSGAQGTPLSIPGKLALIAAVVSIAVKEWMYWYTRHAAKKTGSGALMADAWHHRSDALSSIGSFVGILGARMGFPILDPLVSVIICLFIFKVAYDIFRDAITKLTDEACDNEFVDNVRAITTRQNGVVRIDTLRTRKFGNKIYIDLEIAVNGAISLHSAHAISQKVHDAVETEYPQVKHCMIHLNPAREDDSHVGVSP